MKLNRKIFPALIIFWLLVVDVFLFNDLTLENEVKKFPNFSTVNLEGESITEKIFADKITVLCVWTTNQEICFEVLRELDTMQKNFPADVQVVGLVGDLRADDTEKFFVAKNIAKKYSPQILQLAVNDDFYSVLSKIKSVPTTIFVDKQGNLAGQPAGGANVKFIRRELEYILEKDSPKFSALKKIQDTILFR